MRTLALHMTSLMVLCILFAFFNVLESYRQSFCTLALIFRQLDMNKATPSSHSYNSLLLYASEKDEVLPLLSLYCAKYK